MISKMKLIGLPKLLLTLFLGLSFAIFGAFNFIKSTTIEFPDSTRYVFRESVSIDYWISQNQGSILPTLLFSNTTGATQIFEINTIFWVFGWFTSFLVLAYWNKSSFSSSFAMAAVLFVMGTSSLVISMNRVILTDSIGLSLLVLLASILISIAVNPLQLISKPKLAFLILIYFALFLSKPAWAFLLGLLAIVVLSLSQFSKKFWIISAVAFSELGIFAWLIFLQKLPYLYGYTYEGWYSLTRALDLGQNPLFSELLTSRLLSCPGTASIVSNTFGNNSLLGLPPGFPEKLEECSSVVTQMNQSPISLLDTLNFNPVAFLSEAISRVKWILSPSYYGVTSPRAWLLELHLFNNFFIFIIAIALVISIFTLLLRAREWKITIAFSAFLITAVMGAVLFALQDGIEHSRHVLPMSVYFMFGLLSFSVLLFSKLPLNQLKSSLL